MIKKLISLLLVFVLLLSTISCTGLWPYTNNEQEPDTDNEQEHKEDDEKIGQGMGVAHYTASYEEVKNARDVINGFEGDSNQKHKIVLLESFANEYEIIYGFSRFGSITSWQGLEEFYTAPQYLISASWSAVVFLGECPHEGEDQDHRVVYYLMPQGYEKDHRSSVIFRSSDKIIEAPNPELWTVEKDSRAEKTFDTFAYKFLYDGKVIHGVYSCFELDEEILGKFREDIINAYLPAAE